MRCKHPFKKSISRACWPILRSNSAMRPSAQRWFPLPGNALPGPVRNSRRQRCSTLGLTSNARAASPMETPCSSRRTAASLNSFVNNLRDNPMTQFSFKWILSLNCLCQNWGQVQTDPYGSFVESFGLKTRGLTHLAARRPLRFVDLTEPGALARVGADSRLLAGDYDIAQLWS